MNYDCNLFAIPLALGWGVNLIITIIVIALPIKLLYLNNSSSTTQSLQATHQQVVKVGRSFNIRRHYHGNTSLRSVIYEARGVNKSMQRSTLSERKISTFMFALFISPLSPINFLLIILCTCTSSSICHQQSSLFTLLVINYVFDANRIQWNVIIIIRGLLLLLFKSLQLTASTAKCIGMVSSWARDCKGLVIKMMIMITWFESIIN